MITRVHPPNADHTGASKKGKCVNFKSGYDKEGKIGRFLFSSPTLQLLGDQPVAPTFQLETEILPKIIAINGDCEMRYRDSSGKLFHVHDALFQECIREVKVQRGGYDLVQVLFNEIVPEKNT